MADNEILKKGGLPSSGRPLAPSSGKPPEGERHKKLPPVYFLLLAAALAFFAWPHLAGRRASSAVDEYASLAPGQPAAYSDAALGAVKPQDYALAEPAGAAADTICLWDWADEDGDVVRVTVNGVPAPLANDWGQADLSGAMIRHAPLRVTVPVPCVVMVIGVRDGSGGITYALRLENLGRTVLNRAPVGGKNTYTLAPAGK